MFHLVRALLLIGLFAGLGLRASGAHFDAEMPVGHQASCCEAGEKGCKDEVKHGPNCPPSHHEHEHHQGECCHWPLYVALLPEAPRMFPPALAVAAGRGGNEVPPDGPVMPLDKPPLI